MLNGAHIGYFFTWGGLTFTATANFSVIASESRSASAVTGCFSIGHARLDVPEYADRAQSAIRPLSPQKTSNTQEEGSNTSDFNRFLASTHLTPGQSDLSLVLQGHSCTNFFASCEIHNQTG